MKINIGQILFIFFISLSLIFLSCQKKEPEVVPSPEKTEIKTETESEVAISKATEEIENLTKTIEELENLTAELEVLEIE